MAKKQNSSNQNDLNGNLLVGSSAGSSYTGSEANNVLLSNNGVAAESNVIRVGTQGSSTGQQNVAYIVGPLNISGALTTQPVSSSTATTAFGSLTAGTAKQNTLGYDILININVNVSVVVLAGTLVLGVGSTSTPTTNVVTGSIAAATMISFTAIVPNNYYVLVNTTGTLTVSLTTQVCPL